MRTKQRVQCAACGMWHDDNEVERVSKLCAGCLETKLSDDAKKEESND